MASVTEPAVQSFHPVFLGCFLISPSPRFSLSSHLHSESRSTFSWAVSMETCNYPRHQQFMLNNFFFSHRPTGRDGRSGRPPPPTSAATTTPLTVPSTSFSSVLIIHAVSAKKHVCGSKYSIRAAKCCTWVRVIQTYQ